MSLSKTFVLEKNFGFKSLPDFFQEVDKEILLKFKEFILGDPNNLCNCYDDSKTYIKRRFDYRGQVSPEYMIIKIRDSGFCFFQEEDTNDTTPHLVSLLGDEYQNRTLLKYRIICNFCYQEYNAIFYFDFDRNKYIANFTKGSSWV